jgi:hypothetical protein
MRDKPGIEAIESSHYLETSRRTPDVMQQRKGVACLEPTGERR